MYWDSKDPCKDPWGMGSGCYKYRVQLGSGVCWYRDSKDPWGMGSGY